MESTCQYQVWDPQAERTRQHATTEKDGHGHGELTDPPVAPGNLVPCGKKAAGSIVLPEGYRSLCTEHLAFVKNACLPGIITKENGKESILSPKMIKSLFSKTKRKQKKRVCPHCGKEI